MAHRAEALYLEIIQSSDPAAFIKLMVDRHEPENEVLEFKGMGRLDVNDPAVKAYWSQALSGFANTGGGVLIWGVDARKDNTTGIDGAGELALCPDANAVAQTLRACLIQATTDIVEKVSIGTIVFEEATGSGVVVCWIGEGVNKPYRAELDKSKQYFMRLTDKFVVIPHAFLRSLFYPRLTSKVEAKINISSTAKPFDFQFNLTLTNKGLGTAREVMVVVIPTCPVRFTAFNQHDEWITKNLVANEADAFKFVATRAIHPAQRTYLAGFTWTVDRIDPNAPIQIGFLIRILSLDHPADDVSVIFPQREIQDKTSKVAGAPNEPFDDPKSPFYFITKSNRNL